MIVPMSAVSEGLGFTLIIIAVGILSKIWNAFFRIMITLADERRQS